MPSTTRVMGWTARRLAKRLARRLGFSQCGELLYQAFVLAAEELILEAPPSVAQDLRRVALQNATSIALLLLTTEVLITDLPEPGTPTAHDLSEPD